jgi:hypothetical protein
LAGKYLAVVARFNRARKDPAGRSVEKM